MNPVPWRNARFRGKPPRMVRRQQLLAFLAAGLASAVAHYGVLIGLVEGVHFTPVPATLCGYIAGGVVSYVLNRKLTFASRRSHAGAAWRFAVVAGVGFGLTGIAMTFLTGSLALPYLLAQVLTTGVVLVWSFTAHRFWTFDEAPVL